jgi:hypothetical protein
MGLVIYFGILVSQAYYHEKVSLVSKEWFTSSVFDFTEVELNKDNFDLGMRISSQWPFFAPGDKIEQYFSIQGVVEEQKWKEAGTY